MNEREDRIARRARVNAEVAARAHASSADRACAAIPDPADALPKALERIAHARQEILKAQEVSMSVGFNSTTIFMARDLLEDALRLLGRADLLK